MQLFAVLWSPIYVDAENFYEVCRSLQLQLSFLF